MGRLDDTIHRGRMLVRKKGDQVEVWLPPVDHPEGELVLMMHESYVDEMIACLRAIQPRSKGA